MRKILVSALMIFCGAQGGQLYAATVNAQGQCAGSIDPAVSAIFDRFRTDKNSEGLSSAVAALLVKSAAPATDIACAASSDDERRAAGNGMGTAIAAVTRACTNTECPPDRSAIPEAIADAVRASKNSVILTAASSTAGGFLTAQGSFIPPANYRAWLTPAGTRIGGCTGSPC